MRAFSGAALLAQAGAGPSVSSCGQPGDHFAVSTLKVTPDPPQHGQPMTLTLEGTFDQDVPEVAASVDVELSALGIIHKQLQAQGQASLSPTVLRKGKQTVTVGPFTLPADIPGSVVLKGQIEITTPSSEPVACVALDLDLPAMQTGVAAPPVESTGVSDCGTAKDHVKNVKTETDGSKTTTSFTLDEDVTSAELDVDLELHALFLKVPLKLQVPVTAQPGAPKGDWKIVGEATGPEAVRFGPPVTAEGTIQAKDGQGETLVCRQLAKDEAVVV